MGIIFLIRSGADVHAKDHNGRSVSDLAYARFPHPWDMVGSMQGDVWDFALAVCGYNISDFRQGRCRKAHYGGYYNRQGFEELWAGHEHLCPYYDVEEDTGPCSDEEDEDEWETTGSEDEAMDPVGLEEEE
ncbi:hypothetical protein C8A01DRAFT_18863 [Parachaetomium inaequale]|uniref:Uncharacterized protein n=1 Tax=Parachaetomium inaequale TaxID=2588326 RepID=A0AAN6P9N0_9PEZI|nr:hypothetical protein C8A01DRAFT_18863 [Parachaetomium inaequale]